MPGLKSPYVDRSKFLSYKGKASNGAALYYASGVLPWNLYNNRWFSSLLETDSSEGEQTAFLTPHRSFHHRRFSVVISPTLEEVKV